MILLRSSPVLARAGFRSRFRDEKPEAGVCAKAERTIAGRRIRSTVRDGRRDVSRPERIQREYVAAASGSGTTNPSWRVEKRERRRSPAYGFAVGTRGLKPALTERTVVQALRKATDRLESSGVLRPGWNAEQLLAKQLGCAPLSLYVDPPSIDSKQWIGFESDVACRAGGMPLQYLLGSAEFFGREFQVGPGVFIPRPETEVLLEAALKILDQGGPADRKTDPKDSSLNAPVVVDVGTGCGTIAITLDLEKPGLSLYAIERSRIALSFAIRNARRHEARVRFLEGDLICAFSSACVDLVVANLPYLDPAESAHWPVELHWEPWLALDGGKQGLASIEWLMAQASKVLKPEGTLLLEIAPGQVMPLKQIAQRTGWSVAHVIPDLAGSERVMVLKWKS